MSPAVKLTIAVHDSLLDHPWVQAQADKGHTIVPLVLDCDIAFGPTLHMMTREMLDKPTLPETALKAVRAKRRAT